MTTTSDCTDVSPALNLLVNVVRFSLSRNALYELFLNRYMLREKSRLEDSLRIVNRVRIVYCGGSFFNIIV